MDNKKKEVSLGVAIINVMIILICVGIGGMVFKLPLDMSFLTAVILISILLMTVNKFKAKDLLEFFFEGGRRGVEINLLLMGIGALMGGWIVSGIVPSIIYYGLKFISPAYFLVTGFLLLCVLSFFIGSAFATAGTVGIALMGIGAGMGYPPALTAGMVISGAIFGNKISPFSDSTNLCIVAADVPLLDHIKSMCYTVIPICVISTVLYTIQGMKFSNVAHDPKHITVFLDTLQTHFIISPFLLLVPLLTIALIIKRVSPVIALFLTAFIGAILGVVVQGFDLATAVNALSTGFTIHTGVDNVDTLLNRGGVSSMLDVVALVFFLMGGGEILQQTGTTTVIMRKLFKIVRGARSLVITNLFAGLAVDGLTGSQYLAIILSGEMFKERYDELKVKRTVLSRTLEDSGTIFSYLLPWSNNAVAMGGILGVVVTQSYIYSYQLWFTPIFAIIYAITGFAIWTEKSSEDTEKESSDAKEISE